MDELRGAQVIPFPSRPAPVPPSSARPTQPPVQDDPTQRLQRALALLERAVAEQRAAVGQWRDALGGLRGNMEALRSSLVTYDVQLGTLRGQVEAVNRTARGLETWADAALEAAGARNNHPK